MSEFRGFFLLQNSRDLAVKLQHDYRRIVESPGSHYAAFDFFVTAEHLLDWHVREPKECSRLRREIPLLEIVSHVANGAKHFQADAPHHTSVLSQVTLEEGVSFPLSFPLSFEVKHLLLELDDRLFDEFGSSVSVLDFAGRVLQYWEVEVGIDPLA